MWLCLVSTNDLCCCASWARFCLRPLSAPAFVQEICMRWGVSAPSCKLHSFLSFYNNTRCAIVHDPAPVFLPLFNTHSARGWRCSGMEFNVGVRSCGSYFVGMVNTKIQSEFFSACACVCSLRVFVRICACDWCFPLRLTRFASFFCRAWS